MKTEQITLTTSIKATADLSAKKNLFIGFTGAVCAADGKALGVLAENVLVDEQAPVAVSGIAVVLSGAAVAVGAEVSSNAAGKAITKVAGAINGYALDAATGADQGVRVLLV